MKYRSKQQFLAQCVNILVIGVRSCRRCLPVRD